MKKIRVNRLVIIAVALFLACAVGGEALAESYSASTMRLLHYEGDVQIEDASGSPRFVMENARFSSGEAIRTGADSAASISLDSSKILTLDAESRVEFAQESNSLKMTLTEGRLLLDVQEKLNEDETLEIQTSTTVVGIRGTIVFLTDLPADDPRNALFLEQAAKRMSDAADASELQEILAQASADGQGRVSMLGVLEGTAQISYRDEGGARQTLMVSAGQKATLVDANENGHVDVSPQVADIRAEDVIGFVADQVANDETLLERVENASGRLGSLFGYRMGDEWTWDGTVTLVAQSASKMYDGEPLTRPGDVLVYGLPDPFSIQVRAGGSQTDAGESANPISRYAIYNGQGEDVTDHFSNIETVAGRLVVDPAPITAWTGSAEKVYDGEPLTEPDARLITYVGYERDEPAWRNISYVGTESVGGLNVGSQILYGVCGVTWVHGTNPLTGETQEIELYAGQKMTVHLSDAAGEQSIEFRIEDLAEGDLPEEVLRLYASNPELLARACADTGWDIEVIEKMIEDLPEVEQKTIVEQENLLVEEDDAMQLMVNCTNVRISIDTEITSYNDRALGEGEARYTGISVNDTIVITATGSQTDAGESVNTYEIDWGRANPGNYILSEELGTLTVTPATLTVTTESASKAYDGKPLRAGASLDGLVAGQTAEVTATGSQTNVGSSDNTYTIDWGDTNPDNYSISEDLGWLEVTANDTPITFTAGSGEKVYDGAALTPGEVTAEGLPEGFTFTAEAGGSQTDAGESASAVVSYAILNKAGADVTASFTNITAVGGTLTVTPATLTVTTESASREYDNTPLTAGASMTGLAAGEAATVTATGSQIEVGRSDNTYNIEWGGTNPANYTIAEDLGALEVTANTTPIVLTARSATKVYDGTPLEEYGVEVEGLPSGFVCVGWTAGSQTDVGTSENAVDGYEIWTGAEESEVTSFFTNVTLKAGALEVTANDTAITFTAGSGEKVYDGAALTPGEVTAEGLPKGFTFTAEAGGSQTDVGESASAVAAYAILNKAGADVTASFTNITAVGGTLTVTPATLTVTTESASREYDNTPLTAGASLSGLAAGEAATVTATGSQIEVGRSDNTYNIEWGGTNPANYTIAENLGALEVTANTTPIVLTARSATKVYDGTPLEEYGVEVEGLPSGFVCVGFTAGSQTDAGTSGNAVDGYEIWTGAEESEVTSFFTNVTLKPGTLTVTRRAIRVNTADASKAYDGEPLTEAGITVENLPAFDEDRVTFYTTGSQTDAGHSDNTWDVDWGAVNAGNYDVETGYVGVLTVTKNNDPVTFTASSASREYNGEPLTSPGVTASGLPEGLAYTATATGSQTDVGTSANVVSSYAILKGSEDVTANFGNISTVNGTLEVRRFWISFEVGGPSIADHETIPYDGQYHYATVAVGDDRYHGVASISQNADGSGKLITTWGDEFSFQVNNGGKDAGSYHGTLTWACTKGKKDNYTVQAFGNELEITPIQMTIDLGNTSVAYNGEFQCASPTVACSSSGYTLTRIASQTYQINWTWGDELYFHVDGGGKTVGAYDLTCSGFSGSDSTNTGNYSVTFVPGTVTVTKQTVTIDLGGRTAQITDGPRPFTTGDMSGTYGDGSAVDVTNTDLYANAGDMYPNGHIAGFYLVGGNTLILRWDYREDPGTYTIVPEKSFSGDEANFQISYTNDTLVILEKGYHYGS